MASSLIRIGGAKRPHTQDEPAHDQLEADGEQSTAYIDNRLSTIEEVDENEPIEEVDENEPIEEVDENEPPPSQPPAPKRIRGAPKIYYFMGSFDSQELAKQRLDADGNKWSKRTKDRTLDGDKQFYACTTAHGAKCPTRAYTLVCADSCKCLVFISADVHQHQVDESSRTTGLSQAAKDEVDNLFACGVRKPQLILNNLSDRVTQRPKISQLNGYLSRKRKMLQQQQACNEPVPSGDKVSAADQLDDDVVMRHQNGCSAHCGYHVVVPKKEPEPVKCGAAKKGPGRPKKQQPLIRS